MTAAAAIACSACGGTGWRIVERKAYRCECRREYAVRRLTELANIPQRYQNASFSTFSLAGSQQRFSAAHLWARGFAERYPLIEERGLLLVGTIGTGKTHLAISILRELLGKGIAGRFYDYCDLLRELQASYRPDSEDSSEEILSPAMEVQILVLDDLGSIKPSPFVLDTVAQLLNRRYRYGRTTIITTNFRDAESGLSSRETPLQERVGERVVSRLREMCRFIAMEGPDYRMKAHRPLEISGPGVEGHA